MSDDRLCISVNHLDVKQHFISLAIYSIARVDFYMDKETLEFIQRSSYRQRVLKALDEDVLMPTEIAECSNIKTNHVSKVLAELKSKGLIEIINPEVRKGRLYRLTDVGDEIVKKL